jgi:hypothetical protein
MVKPSNRGGRRAEGDGVVTDLDAIRVPPAAPVQPRQLQRVANDGMDRIPVLDMKEVDALAENARLMVGLDSQPLARMQPPQAALQLVQNFLGYGR